MSHTVLVVDDMAIFRDPIAASLRLAGYETFCASDGKEALALAKSRRPDLILLDVAMPEMDGLTFLKRLRSDSEIAATPVILLTAITEKQYVIQAGQLGASEYLLKSRFKLKDLLERVRKHTAPATPTQLQAERPTAPAPPAASAPRVPSAPAVPSTQPADVPPLLTREQCTERAHEALQAKALSGVVAQVISLASSPRGDLSQLATLISKDPMLSARVLQAANSAAYVSTRGVVTTISEAIRTVGCAAVRNIAATLAIFDAMPAAGPDGFNPLRCWQHSFAVAQICERLCNMTDRTLGGTAYLMGLCHDLGDILFHTRFASELQQVLDVQQRTGMRREDVERAMLGMTHTDLAIAIFQCLGLPDAIREPIECLQSPSPSRRVANSPLSRILVMAEYYANGCLLASSPHSLAAPLTRKACQAATADPSPPLIDPARLRSDVFMMTGMLARLSPKEEQELTKPLFPRRDLRLWLARESAFSSFDPVAAALESMAEVQTHERLPTPEEVACCRGLVVVTVGTSAAGMSGPDIARAAAKVPVLWLVRSVNESPDASGPQPVLWPAPLRQLADFVRSLAALDRKVVAA